MKYKLLPIASDIKLKINCILLKKKKLSTNTGMRDESKCTNIYGLTKKSLMDGQIINHCQHQTIHFLTIKIGIYKENRME